MAKRLKGVDGLAAEIESILDEYQDKINDGVQDAVEAVKGTAEDKAE